MKDQSGLNALRGVTYVQGQEPSGQGMFLVMVAVSVFLGSLHPSFGQDWTITGGPGATAIACSVDARKVVAVVSGGGIYTSGDAASTWRRTTAPVLGWAAVASSADGTKLAAVANGGSMAGSGPIYTSIDS
jgi:hypothetical protein